MAMKRTFVIVIGIALAINIYAYHVTVYSLRTGTTLGAFSNNDSTIDRTFYIGERNGPNTYTAGSPLESRVTHNVAGDGCPCGDVLRIIVVLRMAATPEFYLNMLIYIVPVSLGAYLLRRK